MPSWMVLEAVHPADTFFEIAVETLVGKLSAATARAFLGPPAERELREIFAAAIDTVVDRIASQQDDASARSDAVSRLRVSLRAKRREVARSGKFNGLSGIVATWTETVESEIGAQGLQELGVQREWLAEALCAEITKGVRTNALAGGRLSPLAADADLHKLFGYMQDMLAELASIKGELSHLAEQMTESAARPGAGYGAQTVVEEKTADFVGREYFIKEIDKRITGKPAFPSGYVLIVGEPGIGKTALLAHLIKTRGYLNHINSRRQGITSTQDFLREICRQLARRCGVPETPEPDGSTLSALLRQAAGTARPDAPLVIAIDALDESDPPASLSANRLLLPPILPPHTYFLITTRPQTDYQINTEYPLQVIRIEDDDPSNLLDIRRYIDKQLNGAFAADFARRIRAWKVSRPEFVDTLMNKSQGNFLYVFHMLISIRLERLSRAALDDIRRLPQGLQAYYKYHWTVMADLWSDEPDDMWRKHKDAVRCMAAINRPMSVRMLVQTAGEANLPGVDEELARTIFETWREFFNSVRDRDTEEERLYVYHDTFREFLNDDESLAGLAYRLRRSQNARLRQRLDRYT